MAFMFQNAYAPAEPDENSDTGGASVTDWLKSAGAGAVDLGSQAASGVEALAANANMPNLARVARGVGEITDAGTSALDQSMTPGGRRATNAALLPSDGQASLTEHPLDTLLMKGGRTAAMLGVMGLFPESIVGQALAGGGMGVGAAAQAALSKSRSMDDAQLQSESPTYKLYRETMDETDARTQLTRDQIGGKELFKQALIGAAANGAAARVLKGVDTGANGIKGAALGAVEAGAGMGAQGAGTDYAGQNADVAAGVAPDIDWHRTLLAGLNATAEGAVMGGAFGAWHGRGGEPAKAPAVDTTSELGPDAAQATATAPDAAQGKTPVSADQIANDALAQAQASTARVQDNTPAPAPEAPPAPVAPPEQVAQAQEARTALDNVQAGQPTPAPDTPAPTPEATTAPQPGFGVHSFTSAPTSTDVANQTTQAMTRQDAAVQRIFGPDADEVSRLLKRSSLSEAQQDRLDDFAEKYGPEANALIYGNHPDAVLNEDLGSLQKGLGNVEGAVDRAAKGDMDPIGRELSWIATKLPDIDAAPTAHNTEQRQAVLMLSRAMQDMRAKSVNLQEALRTALKYTAGRVNGDASDTRLLLDRLAQYTTRYAPTDEAPAPRTPQIAPPEAPGSDTTPAEPGGGSVPETPETLEAQQQALQEGKRSAVFYPAGTKAPKLAEGMQRAQIKGRGAIHFNPEMVTRGNVNRMFSEGRENELLGMGPVTKAEAIERAQAGETPVAVTERTPDGTEVKAAAGTDQTAEAQRQALEAHKAKPENTVQVETPEQVIAGRLAKSKDELLDPNRHQVTPEEEARIQQIAEAKAAQERVRQEAIARGQGEEDERITGEDKRSNAEKAKEARDAVEAQQVFAAHEPQPIENQLDRAPEPAKKALQVRLKAMLDDAKARSIKIPEYATKGSSDHIAFLVQAKKLYARLKKSEVTKREIADFKGDELLGRAGDFAEMRARAKIDGEIGSKRGDVQEELHEGTSSGDERIEEERAGREQGEVDERTAVEDHAATEDDEPLGVRRAREAAERIKAARQTPREPEEPGPKVFGARDRTGTFTAQKKRTVRRPDGSIVAHEGEYPDQYTHELADLLDHHEEPDDAEGRVQALNGTVRPLSTVTAAEALDHAARKWAGPPSSEVSALLRPWVRRKLTEAAGNAPVHFVTQDDLLRTLVGTKYEGMRGIQGYYDPAQHQVLVHNNLTPEAMHHTVTHEIVHAATTNMLRSNAKLRGTIDQMMRVFASLERFEDDYDPRNPLTKQYGWKNAEEFIAETFSNQALQDRLGRITLSPTLAKELGLPQFKKYSMWQGIVTAVRRALGLDGTTYTALEAAMKLGHDAMGLEHDMDGWAVNQMLDTIRPGNDRAVASALGSDQISPMVHDEVTAPAEEYVRDPAVSAGRNVLAPLRDAASAAVDALRSPDLPPASRGLLYKLTSNDQLRQMKEKLFGEANERNPLRRFSDTVLKVKSSATHYAQAGDAVARELIAARQKYQGDKGWNQFVSVAHDATHIGVAADQDLDGPGNAHLRLSKENEAKLARGKDVEDLGAMAAWQARTQHEAIHAAYNKLPPELQKLYRRTRQFYVDRQNAMSRGAIASIMRDAGVEDAGILDRIHKGNATDEDYAKFSDDTAEALKNATGLRKLQGDYFPQMRRGKYVITAKHVVDVPKGARDLGNGTYEFGSRREAFDFVKTQNELRVLGVNSAYYDPTTGERTTKVEGLSQAGTPEQRYQVRLQLDHMEMFKNVRDAEARAAELRQAGLENVSVPQLRKDSPGMDQSLATPQVQTLIAKINASKTLTDAQKGMLSQQMLEATTQMRPGVRVEHRALPRKYVLGASDDLVHNTVDYTNSTSSYLARMEHAKTLDRAFAEMKERAFDPRQQDKDTLERQEVFKEFENRVYGSGREDYGAPMSAMTRHLMTVSFIKRMASPAHLLLHLTHPTMISVPVLGARHGVVASYKEIYRAYRDMGGVVSGLGQGVQAMARMAKSFDTKPMNYIDYFASKFGADSGEAQMLRELAETGHVHPEAGLEIHRMMPGENPLTRGLDRFDGAFRELTNATESINRVAEAVAAYRLEMRRNGGNHEQAVRYTKDTLANSQGLYSSANAAPLFRNKALRPFMQFKQFPQMIYHLLGRNLYQAFKGETPEVRKEAAKQFAYVVGTHAAMAGALGLPLEIPKIAVMLAYSLGLTNTNWADIEHKGMEVASNHLGSYAGDILMHGISRAFGPFSPDVHHRLGLNSLLTFGEPESNKGQDTMNYILNTLGGAPGSIALDTFNGAAALRNGDYMKAFELLSPVKALTDITKTAQLGIQGNPSKQGGGMAPLSIPEMALQGMGFTPKRVAEYGEARSMAIREAKQSRDEQSAIIDQWVKASPDKKFDAFKQVQAYNQGKPKEEQITMQQLTSAAKRKSSGGETILGQKVTKRNRRQLEELERIYGVR